MIRSLGIICFLAIAALAKSQEYEFQLYREALQTRANSDFRIGFYNVENLFDLEDDSTTFDEEFTPEGENRYTYSRYKKKYLGLSRTILAMGAWDPVDIMGVSEVENRWVLDGLTKFSPLKNVEYKIIHQDSPDFRGIDIACLYRPDKFNLILYKYYRVVFPFDTTRTTRDMLYVKGILPNTDTLHFFINHWPSRYGGQFSSEPKRAYVAKMLREKVDSLNARFDNPLIAICGDLNDYPRDISVKDILNAKPSPEEAGAGDLVNLMYPVMYKYGTHSYGGEWGVLDQFIVSHSLLNKQGQTYCRPTDVGIFNAPWLLTQNAAGDDVPYRSYQGPAWKGGYSDHLPIFLDLHFKENSQEEQ